MIPNFNYGRFLGEAVESALAVDWPDVEVIVVDDGSTDDSVEVATTFGSRIRLLQQPNQGPRIACNAGFAESSGALVVFLDSDDMVRPEVGPAIEGAWRPGLSKLQFQMQRVDAAGLPRGRPFPVFRRTPSPDQIRRWMRTTAAYPTPPGSGNVYARAFLEQLFPLDDSCGDASDSACLAAAPFLGDVVTVPHPLFLYRIHGANRSDLTVSPRRFTKQIDRAMQRHAFAQRIDGQRDRTDGIEPLFRGGRLLEMRIAQLRLAPEPPPLPDDGALRMLRDIPRVLLAPGPEGIRHRVARAVWCVLVLLGPAPMVRRLVYARYSPAR